MVVIWKKKLNVRTYTPEDKLDLRKEHVIPILSYAGSWFGDMGGFISIFIHGILGSISGFFHAKNKMRQASMKNDKILDLRRKR